MVSRDLFESEVWWRGQRTSTSSGECCVGGCPSASTSRCASCALFFSASAHGGCPAGDTKNIGALCKGEKPSATNPLCGPEFFVRHTTVLGRWEECDASLSWGGERTAMERATARGGVEASNGERARKKKMLKHFFVFPPFFFHTTLSHHTVTSPSPSPPHSHTPTPP